MRDAGNMKYHVFLLLIVFFTSFICFDDVQAYDLNFDPNIISVSSGPMRWEDAEHGIGFRVVVVLSEVYLNIFVQKVEYGEESCCAKITKTYEIDEEKLEGKHQMFSVTDIQWVRYDSFRFKGNSTIYDIKNLDGTYVVGKKKDINKRKR